MHDEASRLHLNIARRSAHHATARDTEINFRRVGVQMVRTDLARLPAGHRDVAFANRAKDFLDMAFGVEHLFGVEIECEHDASSCAPCNLSPRSRRVETG